MSLASELHDEMEPMPATTQPHKQEDAIREFLRRQRLSGEDAEVVMDESDVAREAYREAARAGIRHLKGGFASIYSFQGNRLFAVECLIFAYGFSEIVGVSTFTALAERWHVEKEMVRKLVSHFQKTNGLPPLPGQRSKEGCKAMQERRKNGLQKL